MRTLSLGAAVDAGPAEYRFRTADGLVSPGDFRGAELALLDALWDRTPDRLLVLQGNYGVVGTLLAHAGATVTTTEASARAVGLCRENARRNDARVETTLATGVGDLPVESVDAVAYAPKPYTPIAVVRGRLETALAALDPGGDLFLAARECDGLARYRSFLTAAANEVRTCSTPAGPAVLRAAAGRDPEAATLAGLTHTLSPRVAGIELPLVGAPGLFSARGLDDGTRLLLETTDLDDDDRVLDACCGYGPAAVYAGLTADCTVVASDDDRLATACAERSLQAAGIDATVDTSDCLGGVDGPVDRVLCNPPIHAGEGVLRTLFDRLDALLAPGGVCEVVHHAALSFESHYEPFTVERVASGPEHVVDRLSR